MQLATLVLSLTALGATAPDLPSAGGDAAEWKDGSPELTSIGALTFAPDGVLFVGDAEGARIVAIDTMDSTSSGLTRELDMQELPERIAFATGTDARNIRIHDLAVHPLSGRAYLSVTRGGGSDAQALLVTVSGPDELEVLELEDKRHMQLLLGDAPAPGGSGRRNQRAMSVTDLGFHDGQLYVAGLSNEEFASKLRVFSFPFEGEGRGTNVEVYHGAHGAWETRAPIRTFLPIDLGGEPHLLAGYTCTPLVTFPMSDLAPEAKLRGKTVAELGAGNAPIDMVLYEQGGAQFVLVSNTRHGLIKVSTEGILGMQAITKPVSDKAGLSYESLEQYEDVTQLARLDEGHALLLVQTDDAASLRAIELP